MIERASIFFGPITATFLRWSFNVRVFSFVLHQSESGGWERDGVRLPWCGVSRHRDAGMRGFKVYAGDWMLGFYRLAKTKRGEG